MYQVNVHNGQNVVTFIMFIVMSTEGAPTEELSCTYMRINIHARQAKCAALCYQFPCRASIADAQDVRTMNTACCWCS